MTFKLPYLFLAFCLHHNTVYTHEQCDILDKLLYRYRIKLKSIAGEILLKNQLGCLTKTLLSFF